MIGGEESETDEPPADLSGKQISLAPPVISDFVKIGEDFGNVVEQPREAYSISGGEVVEVSFRSANPRNNRRLEDTFLTVERKVEDGSYERTYVDGDWCTKFIWEGGVGHAGRSTAKIEWDLKMIIQENPVELVGSTFRICHFGEEKSIIGKNKPFEGCSNDFIVTE